MNRNGYLESLRFRQGTSDTSYEYLGVHREDTDYVFRVWAPRADTVYVVGDFNDWSEEHRMVLTDGGIWECAISSENIREGSLYKYKIKSGERIFYKADPYAFCAGYPPETASVIYDVSGYCWRDDGWLSYRRKKSDSLYSQPINIYRLHATSWKNHEDGKPYSWSELATELSTYVKQLGYTHIELMPIAEYFSEDSFGYRVDSYFSPTARLGTPLEFMEFIDSMHEAGIGVIMDWIPTHFSKEEYALIEFDGQPLYEYADENRMENSNFGTRCFDLSKNEVKSFLISNALFWLRIYHIDGLRDAFELWETNDIKFIGDKNDNEIAAIDFKRELNERIKKCFPDVLCSCDLLGEAGIFYAYALANGEQPFARTRLEIGKRITSYKKNVLLMGMEIGQTSNGCNIPPMMEWRLLDNDANAKLQYYVAELNHFYLKSPPLWHGEADSFKWLNIGYGDVISYRRIDSTGKELIVVLNSMSTIRKGYVIEACEKGSYKIVFNSDEKRFGGNGTVVESVFSSEKEKIKLDIPPISMLILSRDDSEY